MNLRTICSSFGCTEVHTDEEYRESLRRRQWIFVGMLIAGVLMILAAGLAEALNWNIAANSMHSGFYSGVGGGLVGGSAGFLLRSRKTMRDPERLHKARIAATDERTLEISRRAIATAGYILLLAVYLVCIIDGLFYPVLTMVLSLLAMVFLLTYVISYFVYNRMM